MSKQIEIDLTGKEILFDTNFIINSLRYPDIFNDLLLETRQCGATIVLLPVVQLEIYKGSETFAHIEQKTEFFNKYIDKYYPIDDPLILTAKKITAAYRKSGANTEITDILLAAALKQYSEKLYLITSNFKDFPNTLFDWDQIICVPKNDHEILNIVIIKFNADKFNNAIELLMRTKK